MPNMAPYTAVTVPQPQPNLGRTGGHTTLQRDTFGFSANAPYSATSAPGTVGSFALPFDIIEGIEFGVVFITDTTAMTTAPQFALYYTPPTVPTNVTAPVTGQPAVPAPALANSTSQVNPSLLTCFPALQYCKQFNCLDMNFQTNPLPTTGLVLPNPPTYPRFRAGGLISLVQAVQGIGGTQNCVPYLMFRTFPTEI